MSYAEFCHNTAPCTLHTQVRPPPSTSPHVHTRRAAAAVSAAERQQQQRRHRSAAARLHGHGQSPVSLLLHSTNCSQDEVLFNSAAPCGLHRRYLGSSGCCHHLLPLPGDVGGGPQRIRASAEQAPAGESHAVQTIWTSPVARVLSLWLAVLGEQLTVLW
jgi:hypothetical protein